jgi:uncharacterized RDD family membrane protein YckC
MSEKSSIITLNLMLMFGVFGVHRFYVGKYFTGILQLLTCGGFFLWLIYDVINFFRGGFTDSSGKNINITYTGPKVFAGFWIRYAAFAIDFWLITGIVLILAVPYVLINLSHIDRATIGDQVDLLNLGITFVYFTVLTASRWQATYGKKLVNIYVGLTDGSRLTPTLSVLRWLAYTISFLPLGLGFVLIGLTKEKTALHDLICSTRVFRGRP